MLKLKKYLDRIKDLHLSKTGKSINDSEALEILNNLVLLVEALSFKTNQQNG